MFLIAARIIQNKGTLDKHVVCWSSIDIMVKIMRRNQSNVCALKAEWIAWNFGGTKPPWDIGEICRTQ